MNTWNFLGAMILCASVAAGCCGGGAKEAETAESKAPVAGTGGDKYVPYEERTGYESVVYFTRDLSAAGLIKAYEQVCEDITGKVAVKLHTGEPNGPNIIP